MSDRREAALLATSTRVLKLALSVANQRGALLVGGPMLVVVAMAAWRLSPPSFLPAWSMYVAAGLASVAALLVSVGGHRVHDQRSRRAVLTGLVLGGGAIAPTLTGSPGMALLLFLTIAGTFVWVSNPDPVTRAKEGAVRQLEERRVVGSASVVAALGWLLIVPGGLATTGAEAAIALGVAAGWVQAVAPYMRRSWAHGKRWKKLSTVATSAAVALTGVGAVLVWDWRPLAMISILLPLAAIAIARSGALVVEMGEQAWWTATVEHPARFLVGTFLLTCLVGGVALSFPACSPRPGGVAMLDAMFTAFSATCVTGLAVVDTPTDYNGLGQAIILVLIQVGGLGIMTFSTATFLVLGQRMSLRHEAAVAELIGSTGRGTLMAAMRTMLLVTGVTELIGALTLTGLFTSRGEPFWAALWKGVFTSVSAFCNAGFALQSDSLVSYQHDPAILVVVSALIIVGAMGPPVVVALPRLVARKKVPVQATMVAYVTAALLVFPAIFIAAAEWNNTLAGMHIVDRLANAWFQSVTLRTAGFNSIDLGALEPATFTMMLLLMFIGGSPGSTAGGVKTTTVMVLLLAVVAALRGRNLVTFAGWRIPHGSVYKSAAITTMGLLSVVVALMLLQLTQSIGFESLLFETVSALATVGLSVGATGHLDGVGKVIIIVCMFMGRVGPLTLFLLLTTPDDRTEWRLPEQEIAVG